VRFDKRDADFWLSADNLAKAPADAKGSFQAPKPPSTLCRRRPPPALRGRRPRRDPARARHQALAATGHTPGHSFYVIESKGQKMVVWGDLMHVAAVQFPDPSVTIGFDSDSKLAAPARKKAFADAAKQGYYVAVAHIAFPGIGHLRAEGRGYVWVPANYSVSR